MSPPHGAAEVADGRRGWVAGGGQVRFQSAPAHTPADPACLSAPLITHAGFLHGDVMAMAGAGLQYWFMQPVFWNILQVDGRVDAEWARAGWLGAAWPPSQL